MLVSVLTSRNWHSNNRPFAAGEDPRTNPRLGPSPTANADLTDCGWQARCLLPSIDFTMEPAAAVPVVPPLQPDVRRIGTQRDILGECPLWDERRQCLWWIDIRAPALRCLHAASGEVQSWVLPELVGSIALASDDRLLVALGCRLALFNPAQGTWQTLAQLAFDEPDMRFNDGRCDRQGRFWFGTMNNITRGPVGRLYRFDTVQGLIEVAQGLSIPNSLAFSPDGRQMVLADSLRFAIEVAPYDPRRGLPGRFEVLAATPSPAFPDGSAIDAEGFLWNAEFHGSRVVRYAPDGHVDRVLAMPTRRPTCCAFGGADLRTLYVTTTSQQMTEAQIQAEPLAGALLALPVDVPGLPEPRFDLSVPLT
jgi:sugar lactone lactonase YvrE